MSSRISEIDFVKGVGILFVLLGHAGLSGFPRVIVYGFHMPLFFFVSGLFFKRKPPREYLLMNCRRLLYTYCIFAFILVLSTLIYSVVTRTSIASNVITQLNPMKEESRCLYLSIWFFICLFVVRVLFYLISYVEDNALVFVFTCLLGAVGLAIQGKVNIPFFIDSAFSMLPFYGIGYLISPMIINRHMSSNRILCYCVGCIALVLYSLLCYKLKPIVDVKQNLYPIITIPLTVLAIVSVYSFSIVLAKSRFLGFIPYLGRKSVYLLGLHRPIFLFLIPILYNAHFHPFISMILLLAATIAISLLIAVWLQKIFPRVFVR